MSARLNPTNSSNPPSPSFSRMPSHSSPSATPQNTTHAEIAPPQSKESQQASSKEVPTSSKESQQASAKEVRASSASSENQFSKMPKGSEKKTAASETPARNNAAAIREAYEANKILLVPGQVITAKGLELMMNQAAHKRGEFVKFEVSADASIEKGTILKRHVGVFVALGLSFSKEDSGHVQIQFSAEAAARAGVSFGDFLKISGGVGANGKITLRFDSAKDAAAWIANAVGHLPVPLFKAASVSLPHQPPTLITEYGASVFVEAKANAGKRLPVEGKTKAGDSVSIEGKATAETMRQTFTLPSGQQVPGVRTTTKSHIKGEFNIGEHKLEFQREKTEYTQQGDPVFTNNGTYRQIKWSAKVPVALFKGHKDKAMAVLAGLVKQAGFPALSAQGMNQLYERFSKLAGRLGNAAHVGVSLEWNDVKENGEFRPLNRRVFLNVGIEKEGKLEIHVKAGKVEASVKAGASKAQLLMETVYGRSEAYLSQVYTGAISKQEWAQFEERNKPALLAVLKNHQKLYPRGAVQTAYKEALARTKDPNKANQAALEALKKVWTDTYNAKPEIEKDACTIFNRISKGRNLNGEIKWKSFPVSKSDQEAIENLILKYKDKPEMMAELKNQLTQWLGESSLKNVQLALQQKTGSWFYPSFSDGPAFRILSPSATFQGNNDGQAKIAADGIIALAPKIKSGSLSEEEKQQIEKAVHYAAQNGYLPALKALLVQHFGEGHKNLTVLQNALLRYGSDSNAYIRLAGTNIP